MGMAMEDMVIRPVSYKKRPQGAQPHNIIVRDQGFGEASPTSRQPDLQKGKSGCFCSSL